MERTLLLTARMSIDVQAMNGLASQEHPVAMMHRPDQHGLGAHMIRRVVANHDGSTTSLLESLTNDVVRVKVLEHRAIRCGKNADALQCSADACAVRRQVELSARGRIVLRATAVLVPSRLPHSLMEQLGHTTLAFGALLRCHRVETYREREDYSVDLVKHTLT